MKSCSRCYSVVIKLFTADDSVGAKWYKLCLLCINDFKKNNPHGIVTEEE
jgi:hypothetical protein